MRQRIKVISLFTLALGSLSFHQTWAANPAVSSRVSFNRDVRPILSENCFSCHGPDQAAREADLRFDIPEPDGGYAFVPGKPEQSEAFKRIASTDPEEQMPPPDSNKRLTKEQIAILRQWVAEGAEYQPHWSFVPPKSEPLPSVKHSGWVRNGIDHFVVAKLEREKLSPTPEADKATLLRRLSFDLTGLPPEPAEIDAFVADRTPDAYERAVDRLLRSPHHGERLAMDWLDVARYADTNGYFRDAARQNWPWRDWLISAFNRNLRYDQFTIEQLAGDLLPEPTTDQRIATGFNRNSMTNNESGLIDEEYRVEYVAERTETVGTVWMGMTVGCARCHDHKYDPISQKEFYQLFAFFNSSPEPGLVKPDTPPPVMDVATSEQRSQLEQYIASKRRAEASFNRLTPTLNGRIAEWEKCAEKEIAPLPDVALHIPFEPETPGIAEKGNVHYEEQGLIGRGATFDGMNHVEAPTDLPLVADRPWSLGLWMKPTGPLNGVMGKAEATERRRGFEVVWQKGRFKINLVHQWGVNAIEVVSREPSRRSGDWVQMILTYDGSRRAAGLRLYVDGDLQPLNVERDTLTGDIGNTEPLKVGRRDSGLGFYGQLEEFRFLTRSISEKEARAWYWSDRLRGALAAVPEKRDARAKQYLLDYYVMHHGEAEAREAHAAVLKARETEAEFRALLPKTMVMEEMAKPRGAHVLERGKYDSRGEPVQPGVPAVLPPLPRDAPPNRLGLAQWLTLPDHPLTARVAVNRFWQLCFGQGLVSTLNDFGAQGDAPTHPELLDWLAVNFVQSGWNMRELVRLIVTSATYRQSSVPTAALNARDPENRLLARGPRFRLPAEMIRDQALAASGLLVRRLGGPSVKPYQPPGVWEAVTYDSEYSYEQDTGDGLWRRSLYTFWRRQAPPPSMLVFDGPTREVCTVKRARTNTPLQALALLNDVTFVEAGRALAATALASPGSDRTRLQAVFRRAVGRSPDTKDLKILQRLLDEQRAHFRARSAAARDLVVHGSSEAGRNLDPVELAAWSVTAHALLNLDEAVMRR